jgi:hypothetical protein
MVIHTYLTDGFFPWSIIFVKSLIRFHKDLPIFIDTRNLTQNQCNELLSMSDNIEIENKKIDLEYFKNCTNLNNDQITQYKKEVETDRSYESSVVWKQFISVEDRYRLSLPAIFNKLKDNDIVIHFDIDMYIRQPLDELFSIAEKNDVCIRFRNEVSKKRFKVLGNIISFKVGKNTRQFINKWCYYIDKVPLIKKPIAYGQKSFYLSYLDFKDILSWGGIPEKFSDHKFDKKSIIWTANDKHLGKTKVLDICWEDFNK